MGSGWTTAWAPAGPGHHGAALRSVLPTKAPSAAPPMLAMQLIPSELLLERPDPCAPCSSTIMLTPRGDGARQSKIGVPPILRAISKTAIVLPTILCKPTKHGRASIMRTGPAYACTHIGCSYVGTKRRYLVDHVRCRHGLQKNPFRCAEPGCNYESKYKGHLGRHMKGTHMGLRPHRCDWAGCNYTTSQGSHLTTHRLKHTGERPFVCPEPGCRSDFTRKAHMDRHIRDRHRPIARPVGGPNQMGTLVNLANLGPDGPLSFTHAPLAYTSDVQLLQGLLGGV